MEDLTNREIRLYLLDLLNDKREKAFIEEKVKIFAKAYEKVINFSGALDFFFKFQLEDGIIKNIQSDIQNGEDYSIMEFTESFDDYIKNELASQVGTYLKKFGEANLSNNSDSKTDAKVIKKEVLYKITYSAWTEIIINNIAVIKKLQIGVTNDIVFKYLLETPNEIVTSKDIREKNLGLKARLDFNKIVGSIGFKGDLRKIFFTASKSTVIFRNPIYKEDFEQLGLPELRLRIQDSKKTD